MRMMRKEIDGGSLKEEKGCCCSSILDRKVKQRMRMKKKMKKKLLKIPSPLVVFLPVA